MTDAITALFILSGCAFMMIAAIGILRLPDTFTRMHAATKVGTVGIVNMLLAVAVYFPDTGVAIRAGLIIVFFFLTAPIAAQVIARVAYQQSGPKDLRLENDAYRDVYLARLRRDKALDEKIPADRQPRSRGWDPDDERKPR